MGYSAEMMYDEAIRQDLEHVEQTVFEKHMHKAEYDEDGELTDCCAVCGLDLRNPIHLP